MNTKINIAYSSDNNYVRMLGVSLLSLLENNKEINQLNIYIIDNGIDDNNIEYLKNLVAGYSRNIYFIKFKNLCKDLKTDGKFSVSSFSRLFLSQLEDIEKIIYLDCDTIIERSLINLWNIEIDEYYIAGVEDFVTKDYRDMIGFSKKYKYINAGVLLINLRKWREDSIENQFLKCISYFKGSVPHHDQGTLNAICKDKILILSPEYNVMSGFFDYTRNQILKLAELDNYYSEEQLEFAKKNPVIIHFTAGFKNRPWNTLCSHPLKDRFKNYNDLVNNPVQYIKQKDPINIQLMKFVFSYMPFNTYLLFIKILKIKKKLSQRIGEKNE